MPASYIDRPPKHLFEMLGAEVASRLGFEFKIIDCITNTCIAIRITDTNRKIIIVSCIEDETIVYALVAYEDNRMMYANRPTTIDLNNPAYDLDRVMKIVEASMADNDFRLFPRVVGINAVCKEFGIET